MNTATATMAKCKCDQTIPGWGWVEEATDGQSSALLCPHGKVIDTWAKATGRKALGLARD